MSATVTDPDGRLRRRSAVKDGREALS